LPGTACRAHAKKKLEVDMLTDWKPVELSEHWCNVIALPGIGLSVISWASAFCTDCKQIVSDAAKQ